MLLDTRVEEWPSEPAVNDLVRPGPRSKEIARAGRLQAFVCIDGARLPNDANKRVVPRQRQLINEITSRRAAFNRVCTVVWYVQVDRVWLRR